ncbi:MAG: tetratricopeptide repeat protein [Chthoniobacterales bacterium]
MRFTIRASLSLLFLACCVRGHAQEVRRAIPVYPQGAAQNPSATPQSSPRSEPPTAKAVPFSYDDVASPTPSSAPRPLPTPKTTPPPVTRPSSVIAPINAPVAAPSTSVSEQISTIPSPTPDADGTIRLAPGTAQNQASSSAAYQLEAANGFYSRKIYDMAVPEYEKFLIEVPKHGDPLRQQALFRLGESQRFQTNINAARDAYERLLQEFNTGPYTGAAAYRLAEILYGDKSYTGALQMYRKAYENSTDADVKLTARFYEARSLDALNRQKESAPIYLEISAIKEKNPYRDFALLSLADGAAASGKKDDAFQKFMTLSTDAEKPSLRTEATFRAATLAEAMGQKEKARELYNKVAKSGSEELSGPATIGALRMAYDLNDYKAVIGVSFEAIDKLPGDALPDAILLVANSYRQLGDYQKAADLYDKLIRNFANTTAARDAHFQRIVSLYSLNDKNTMKEIDDFLLLTSNPKERSQAYLLKAELLFKDKKFTEAVPIYTQLATSDLSDNFKADALYKLGWSQAHTQDYAGAVTTFTCFITKYPNHAFVPTAIAQRALSYQQNKDYDSAIKDFDLLIEKYPKAPERELALQQKALLLGQQQKSDEMVATFGKLLTDYPKSAAAAQANFWIGRTAYDKKDYKLAMEKLNLSRTQDPAQYGDRASLCILLSAYTLKDREGTAKEISRIRKENIPPEILSWLGTQYIEEGNYAKAEQFLMPLTKLDVNVRISPEVFISLAQAELNQKKWKEALLPITRYLDTARDPISRARGLLANAQAQIGLKHYAEAQKSVDEALLLQPEGRWNAEARMLQAEVSFAKDDFTGAARQFMSIALLYDDKIITPRALLRARDAFQRANNPVDADKALRELTRRFPDSSPQSKVSSQKI